MMMLKQKEKEFAIKESQINMVFAYLGKRPYAEVAQLFHILSMMRPLDPPVEPTKTEAPEASGSVPSL